MTYGVPGASAGRHIVFDAPEDGNGMSVVKAAAQSGRCVLTITAGAGVAGRPLMFTRLQRGRRLQGRRGSRGGGRVDPARRRRDGGHGHGATGGGTGAGSTGGGAVSGDSTGAGSTGGGAIAGGPTGGFMGTGEKLVGGCSCLLCSGTNRALDWTGLAVAVALVCFARYRRPSGR